jgi:nucleoid-associated protein YgaU
MSDQPHRKDKEDESSDGIAKRAAGVTPGKGASSSAAGTSSSAAGEAAGGPISKAGTGMVTHEKTGETRTYTVKAGDSLSKIAKALYGDAAQWKKIYEANRETIGSNPDRIKPGQVLTIP